MAILFKLASRPLRYVLLAVLSLCGVGLHAQPFPSRAVTIVNPYPAGGGADNLIRTVATQLSQEWGQPVLIENRPGAGTTLAAAHVAKAKPDGYTLLLSSSQHAIAPLLFKSLPYDYLSQLSPIATLSFSPFMLVTPSTSELQTVTQLMDALRKRGDRMNFASSGQASLPHLSGVMLNQATGAKATHVPYAGTSPATQAVIGGTVDFLFADNSVLPLIQSGKVKALAITSDKRSERFPNIPTLSETLPGFEVTVWTGLEAPAGTPRSVIDRIHASILSVMKQPGVVKFFNDTSRDMKILGPEEFARFKEAEVKGFAQLVQKAQLNLSEN
jgi:tripartite-type tricarboxylate transporter receptor subunit TctC